MADRFIINIFKKNFQHCITLDKTDHDGLN